MEGNALWTGLQQGLLPSWAAESHRLFAGLCDQAGRLSGEISGCGSKPMVPFWGRCTTHFSRDFSGDWDVHWGYGILTHGHI